jgi:hypothetical protein
VPFYKIGSGQLKHFSNGVVMIYPSNQVYLLSSIVWEGIQRLMGGKMPLAVKREIWGNGWGGQGCYF